LSLQVRKEVDYRKVAMLNAFTGRHAMLLGRRKRHVKAATQRKVARAVKNARQMALMPHVGLHLAFEDDATRALREQFEVLDATAKRAGL
jgi:ribosomal protein S18